MDFPDPKYREMCSAATLQSSKKGFFKDFVEAVLRAAGKDWIEEVFSKQTLEKDKVRICCTDGKVWNAIQIVLQNVSKLFREKSGKAARDARLEGDRLYAEGNHKKAVMFYSQSVIRSPGRMAEPSIDDGITLALAYKNRANAFYALEKYLDCLTDLHLTMEEGHPEPLKYQIYRQMGECYKGLRQHQKAKISFQVALKLIDEQILKLNTTVLQHGSKRTKNKDVKLRQVIEKERDELQRMISSLPNKDLQTKGGEPTTSQHILGPVPELTGCSNEKHPTASNLVTMKHTVEEGRFAVAADSIETGATLVVEEPHASCLIPDMLSSHCHHCYSRLDAPIPCKTCAGLAFCSVQCRDASSNYHKHECQLMGLLIGSGMSVLSFLALRMITQEGLEFFRQLQAKIESLKQAKEKVEFTSAESKYIQIYNLTTHSDLRLNQDYFNRTLMAIFLVRCLKETNFFEKETKSEIMSEDEILTASLILHHLQILQFNAHEIYETRVAEIGQTRGAKTVYIAVGIYPTVALFNHDCAPSVTRYFHGKKIVIKAVRPLVKDCVISENYGPIFTKRTLMERLRDLTSRYWFKCKCLACVEDWPTLEFLTDAHFKLRCKTLNCQELFQQPTSTKSSETNPRCQRCLNRTNLLEVLKRKSHVQTLFEKGLDYMDSQKCDKAVPLFIAFLDEMFLMGAPPCKEISLCQEALRTCYAQTGNLWVVN